MSTMKFNFGGHDFGFFKKSIYLIFSGGLIFKRLLLFFSDELIVWYVRAWFYIFFMETTFRWKKAIIDVNFAWMG